MPQAWNMDGFGRNCGPGGFGFNIGGAAQDICVDGRLIVASQVPPPTPLAATPAPGLSFPPDACSGELLLGRRPDGQPRSIEDVEHLFGRILDEIEDPFG
jgi:hypothetical protein